MADGEDASVEPMQSSRSYGPVDGTTRIPQRPSQLANRNHSVLPLRQVSQSVMSSSFGVSPSFASHSGTKEGDTPNSPPTQPVFRPSERSERKKTAGQGPAVFR